MWPPNLSPLHHALSIQNYLLSHQPRLTAGAAQQRGTTHKKEPIEYAARINCRKKKITNIEMKM